MAVPIAAEPAFEAKKPAFLFRQTNVVGWRDISPDGKRFVMMKEAGLGLKQASLKRAREAAQYSNSVQVPGISFYIGK
jgi:hypothetical protein